MCEAFHERLIILQSRKHKIKILLQGIKKKDFGTFAITNADENRVKSSVFWEKKEVNNIYMPDSLSTYTGGM